MPAATTELRTCSRMGRFATGSMTFGRFFVSGRSRVPSPAARMTACISGILPHHRVVCDRSCDKGVGSDFCSAADRGSGIYGTVDPKQDIISDNGAELLSPGGHPAHFYRPVIVTKIGDLCSGAEITSASDHTVADVIVMRDLCIIKDDGVFYFDRMTDMTVVSDRRSGPQICVGSDNGVFADNTGTFDVCSGFYDGTLSKDQLTF